MEYGHSVSIYGKNMEIWTRITPAVYLFSIGTKGFVGHVGPIGFIASINPLGSVSPKCSFGQRFCRSQWFCWSRRSQWYGSSHIFYKSHRFRMSLSTSCVVCSKQTVDISVLISVSNFNYPACFITAHCYLSLNVVFPSHQIVIIPCLCHRPPTSARHSCLSPLLTNSGQTETDKQAGHRLAGWLTCDSSPRGSPGHLLPGP